MVIADPPLRTNLTVGRSIGRHGGFLTAAAVMIARVAIDAVTAVHHKISISGPAQRAARQVVGDYSGDDSTSGHESRGGRTSSSSSFIFFRFPPPPSSLSERNQGQRSWNPAKKRGSFLAITLLHGSLNPESRATLKSIFLWNFGISENMVADQAGQLLCLGGVIWSVIAILGMLGGG